MITQRLFNTIQSGKIKDVYRAVTDAALYIATAGYIKEANLILEKLWQYQLPHDRETWLPDKAFQVLWHSSKEYPHNIPFELEDINSIEDFYRQYIGGDHYAYPMSNAHWQELSSKDGYRLAQIWFLDPKNDNSTFLLIQKALEESESLAPYELATGLVIAAELAAKLGNDAFAIKMAQKWAENYHEYYVNYSFSLMPCCRHLTPFILRGELANPLRLSQAICTELVKNISSSLEKRMATGTSLVYGDLTWQELLKKMSLLALKEDPQYYTDKQKQESWLGRDKASITSINDTEIRLGVQLPEDYKAFLQESNGFSNFFPNVFCDLLPVEEIDFYKKIEDPELYEITADYIDVELYENDENATLRPYLERAILIGKSLESEMVFLIPPDKKDKNWAAWFFASWRPGEERFSNFRQLIESQLQSYEEL